MWLSWEDVLARKQVVALDLDIEVLDVNTKWWASWVFPPHAYEFPLVFVMNYLAHYRDLNITNKLAQFDWKEQTAASVFAIGVHGVFGLAAHGNTPVSLCANPNKTQIN